MESGREWKSQPEDALGGEATPGLIFQGLPDAPDDDRLCSLVGRRLDGIIDIEKHLRVIVVPVPMPGARARQTLLVALDPDCVFTRQIIDVVDLWNTGRITRR
jgi:hypothetical protein